VHANIILDEHMLSLVGIKVTIIHLCHDSIKKKEVVLFGNRSPASSLLVFTFCLLRHSLKRGSAELVNLNEFSCFLCHLIRLYQFLGLCSGDYDAELSPHMRWVKKVV
jgi:hypothetical protein